MEYVNEFGLKVRTGLDAVVKEVAGERSLNYYDIYLNIDFDEDGLPAGSAEKIHAYIPAGSIIDSAALYVSEAANVDTSTLDFGTKKLVDGVLTVEDSDGLLDGETLAAGRHAAVPGAQVGIKTTVDLFPYVDNVSSAADADLAGLKGVLKVRYVIVQ